MSRATPIAASQIDVKSSAALARALLTVEGGADALHSPSSIAACVDQVWTKLANHFARLIGDAGVQAVLFRSVTVAKAGVPWLAVSLHHPDDGTPSLRAAFEGQSAATGIDGFGDLLSTLIALLGRFIGDVLVQQLLFGLWPTVFPCVPKESP